MTLLRAVATATLFSTSVYANTTPTVALDSYLPSEGIPTQFVRISDPNAIVLKNVNSEEIYVTYSIAPELFEQLYEYGESFEHNQLSDHVFVRYSKQFGPYAHFEALDLNVSVIDPHLSVDPIEVASKNCLSLNPSTLGKQDCLNLELEYVDLELNRIYQDLGGSDNVQLSDMQKKWIAYKDAKIAYLQSQYLQREGTMWGLVYADNVNAVYKQQLRFLRSISSNQQ
ncbi:lysozyme inhibitor LprI family protein [Vibrio maerlii]|uniref:lysozyme inhibitor LprI family protein n=1 Tax=Vibrio maerlii TaxID=2231648 RepID=UPI000E3DCAA5|nr:lysozyme inhibitor LprI family protein [Vibrio maerlii]